MTEMKHRFECEFCNKQFIAKYSEPSHTFEPRCPKCKRNKDVIEAGFYNEEEKFRGKKFGFNFRDW